LTPGGKFTASIVDTGGKFTADVVMKFWIPVCGAPCFAAMYRRLFRISREKKLNKVNGIIRKEA
jgi:hypothetical protein